MRQAILICCVVYAMLGPAGTSFARDLDLVSLLRIHRVDVEAISSDLLALYDAMESRHSTNTAQAFADHPDIRPAMRAYALARKASIYQGKRRPDLSVETLRIIAGEFESVPIIAQIADLKIFQLMAQQGGTNEHFDPSILVMTEQMQRILSKYSRFSMNAFRERVDYASECEHAATHPLLAGFRYVAVETYKQILADIEHLAKNPDAADFPEELERIAQEESHVRFLLDRLEKRMAEKTANYEKRDLADWQGEHLYSAAEAEALDLLSVTELRSLVEADELIPFVAAQAAALRMSLRARAILVEYVDPKRLSPHTPNALRITTKLHSGFVTTWVFDTFLSHRADFDEQQRIAFARALNPRDFIENMAYFGGREESFVPVFGEGVKKNLYEYLQPTADPRAQRNAAYFLMPVVKQDPETVESLVNFVNQPRGTIGFIEERAIVYAMTALGRAGTVEAMDFLKSMATSTFWDSRSDSWLFEEYNSMGAEDGRRRTRERVRYNAYLHLGHSKTPESEARVRWLRETGAPDLFEDEDSP